MLHVNTHHAEDFHPIRPLKKDVLLQCIPSVVPGECLSKAAAVCTAQAVADWTDWKTQRESVLRFKKTKNVHEWTLKSLLSRGLYWLIMVGSRYAQREFGMPDQMDYDLGVEILRVQHNSASQQQHGNHKTQKSDLEVIKTPVWEI